MTTDAKVISHWAGKVRDAVRSARDLQHKLDMISEIAQQLIEASDAEETRAESILRQHAETPATCPLSDRAKREYEAQARDERFSVQNDPGYMLAKLVTKLNPPPGV
jgi:hypothetical protein